MRRVYQTRFGVPEGNCTEAVIASLLHLDLAEVPELRLCAERGGTVPVGVNDVIDTFLASRGYARVVIRMDARPWPWIPAGIVVAAGGTGPRGFGHLCVYRSIPGGFDLLHDPHPDGGGLVEVEDVWFLAPVTKQATQNKSAAENALDAIAAEFGCAEWEYPGQVARDAKTVVEMFRRVLGALDHDTEEEPGFTAADILAFDRARRLLGMKAR